MIFFKGQKAVPWTRANPDVANQDFSHMGRDLCISESEFAKTRSLGGGIRTSASGNQIRCTRCRAKRAFDAVRWSPETFANKVRTRPLSNGDAEVRISRVTNITERGPWLPRRRRAAI